MPQKCTICIHENQEEMDELLLSGTPLRKIASQYDASAAALQRHKQHISKIVAAAHKAVVIAKADTLLDQVKNLLSQAERLTARAEQAGSLDTALRGIAQVRGVLELLGEVSGQLAGKGTNIAIGINNGGGGPTPNFRSMSNEELQQILKRNGHPVPLLEGPNYRRGFHKMNIDRTKAIELAEQAYRQEQELEAKFRAFMGARLGLAPGTVTEEIEMLMRAPATELTDEQLHARLFFHWGLPPDCSLSEEQISMVCRRNLATVKAERILLASNVEMGFRCDECKKQFEGGEPRYLLVQQWILTSVRLVCASCLPPPVPGTLDNYGWRGYDKWKACTVAELADWELKEQARWGK